MKSRKPDKAAYYLWLSENISNEAINFVIQNFWTTNLDEPIVQRTRRGGDHHSLLPFEISDQGNKIDWAISGEGDSFFDRYWVKKSCPNFIICIPLLLVCGTFPSINHSTEGNWPLWKALLAVIRAVLPATLSTTFLVARFSLSTKQFFSVNDLPSSLGRVK